MNERICRGSLSSNTALISRVKMRIVKWDLDRKDFNSIRLNDIYSIQLGSLYGV